MYVARPGIEPRPPYLRVRCPTDCARRPGAQRETIRGWKGQVIMAFPSLYATCPLSRRNMVHMLITVLLKHMSSYLTHALNFVWVFCFGFNGPSRQNFSLYRERGRK